MVLSETRFFGLTLFLVLRGGIRLGKGLGEASHLTKRTLILTLEPLVPIVPRRKLSLAGFRRRESERYAECGVSFVGS